MKIIHGDCLTELANLPENSLDSCVTDPPYGLKFMGKEWDHGVPGVPFWTEVLRVLKPGAHLLAFGGTRTVHRLTCAIEDAGFEIRDKVLWLTGQGFPKSRNVSKAIDAEAGVEREVLERRKVAVGFDTEKQGGGGWSAGEIVISAPATEAAKQWDGWGTALKPAMELICLARKPLSESTVAANVLRWGTGALNVDGCRVPGQAQPFHNGSGKHSNSFGGGTKASHYRGEWTPTKDGRWPANVVHDGSDEVVGMFPNTAPSKAGVRNNNNQGHEGWSGGTFRSGPLYSGHSDSGSAARFFYSAKASKADRAGSKHPTCKPIKLMQWLARMITPPCGTVLDPFAGSGTTGEACRREGFDCILIEKEAEYIADIKRRMKVNGDELEKAAVETEIRSNLL